jgi:D-sedoheptulose 7-phosphate isomerase
MNETLFDIVGNHIETVTHNFDQLAPLVEQANTILVQTLLNDQKVLACGNGASAALAQHFATMLLNRFEHERPGLPAIALNADGATLSAIGSDNNYNDIFSRQIAALGQDGDTLLVISTGGNAASLIQAIQTAHDRGMTVIVLNGRGDSDLSSLLLPGEPEIGVDTDSTARAHEIHLLIIHCFGKLIDQQIFGGGL